MSHRPDRAPSRTVIVGAGGRMGRMLCARAADAGIAVAPMDRPLTEDVLAPACSGAQLAILCVPAAAIAAVLGQLCPHLPDDCVLADITSVKVQPLAQMEQHWQGPVVGTHPLFGPNPGQPADASSPRPSPSAAAAESQDEAGRISPSADGQRIPQGLAHPVAIVPGGNAMPRHTGIVEAFFRGLGFETFRTTARDHDVAMSLIQGMNFITSLAYFSMLAGRRELLPFITPSFRRRLASAEKLLTEDAELFAGLFDANPFSHEAVRQFRKMLNIAAAGDVDLLCERARWWWRDAGGPERLGTDPAPGKDGGVIRPGQPA